MSKIGETCLSLLHQIDCICEENLTMISETMPCKTYSQSFTSTGGCFKIRVIFFVKDGDQRT